MQLGRLLCFCRWQHQSQSVKTFWRQRCDNMPVREKVQHSIFEKRLIQNTRHWLRKSHSKHFYTMTKNLTTFAAHVRTTVDAFHASWWDFPDLTRLSTREAASESNLQNSPSLVLLAWFSNMKGEETTFTCRTLKNYMYTHYICVCIHVYTDLHAVKYLKLMFSKRNSI